LKVFWMKMNNYRQYRGENLIEFSVSENKPITIIQGTTGAGKTTVLNAMYWCLYGEEPSYHETTDGVAPICNRAAMSESKATVEMSVELAFGEDEPKYYFKRKLMVWNLDKVQPSREVVREVLPVAKSERETTIYLNENLRGTVNFDAWTKERRGDAFTEAPDYLVDNILPHELAFVFFFNGEELKEFFQKKNKFGQALEDISQITLVKRAIDQLDAVETDLRRQASKGSVNTEALSLELDQIERTLTEKRTNTQHLEGELGDLNKRLSQIDTELKALNIDRVTHLVESRNDAVRRGSELAKDYQVFCDERNKQLLETAPAVYLGKQISFTLSKISEFDQRGKLPPPIRTVFLKDLLDKGTCICGRSIAEHEAHDARQHIQKLLDEEASDEAVSFKALDGRFKLEAILNSSREGITSLIGLGEKIADKEAAMIQAEEKAKSVGKELAQYESPGASAEDLTEKVRSLQSVRSDVEKAKNDVLSELGGDKRDIERLENSLKDQKRSLDKEVAKSAKNAVLKERWEFAKRSLETLSKIRDDMVSEVRREIQAAADSHFRELVWKTTNLERKAGEQSLIDPGKLQQVRIGDDNEISVITKDGENWIMSLSQGETQTLAYSFISALKEGAKVIFPMVVDTPLGIIDEGPPRELFAELLPDFVKDTQLVFLMTSAEYSPAVKKILAGQVGRTYKLEYRTEEGATKVKELA
jgi:DNA sulfur modification protein DndD